MSTATHARPRIALSTDDPVWDRFFSVAPLVVVGTKEADGRYDLAPKHMATPLGWENLYGFVCTPRHGTYRNVRRHGEFTVSFPRPGQVLDAALAASPRGGEGLKDALDALATTPATAVDGVVLEGAPVTLECTLERIVDGFGDASLVAGRVVAAEVDERALRPDGSDDRERPHGVPLLAYLAPGRFAPIASSFAFPFPSGFRS